MAITATHRSTGKILNFRHLLDSRVIDPDVDLVDLVDLDEGCFIVPPNSAGLRMSAPC